MITVTFEAGNTNVRIVRIVTDSTLAQVTTAGWYSNTAPNQLNPSDEVEIAYSQGTNLAATAFFSVTITAGVVTLSVAESGVILPVVSGNLAVFSGTSGTIADSGIAASNVLVGNANNTIGSFLNLKYGATPVAQIDPGSCTITAAAGTTNTATVTIQLKDGSGTNLTRSVGFRVYASSAADGLTLASAASTGFSVASGGLSLANGTAITTQITAMSSASGGCVLSLLDTGKQTSYLVLVLPSGNKISAQLTSGSYG